MIFNNISLVRRKFHVSRLREISNTLRRFGLDSFLVYGTLLGAVRSNELISHDHDLDIAVLCKSKNKQEIKKEIISCYTQLKNEFKIKKIPYFGQIRIFPIYDIWFCWEEYNKFYLFHSIYGNFELTDIKPFKQILLLGIEFNIPRETEKILTYWYGENWRIQDHTWHYARDGGAKIDNFFGKQTKSDKNILIIPK